MSWDAVGGTSKAGRSTVYGLSADYSASPVSWSVVLGGNLGSDCVVSGSSITLQPGGIYKIRFCHRANVGSSGYTSSNIYDVAAATVVSDSTYQFTDTGTSNTSSNPEVIAVVDLTTATAAKVYQCRWGGGASVSASGTTLEVTRLNA